MANPILLSHTKALGTLLCIFVLHLHKGGAYEFMVGGSKGWNVPNADAADTYTHWAQTQRFQIGDTILFVYPADKDSVLLVTKENYINCTTENPLQNFNDGHTLVKFTHSGPHYFISGVADHCHRNEKLLVVVMADRNNQSSPPPEVTPSPAPSGYSPPPPPSSSVEINPTPAPAAEAENPPPSAAASIITTFVCSLGPFLASSLLLVF